MKVPRWAPAMGVVVGIIVGFLITGCSDATGPSEPELHAQFRKVYNAPDGSGGGGGGGASGSGFDYNQCTKVLSSAECTRKLIQLVAGAGALTACGAADVASAGAATFLCTMGGLAWADHAQDWLDTPDCRNCGVAMPGDANYPTIGPDPRRWDFENQ